MTTSEKKCDCLNTIRAKLEEQFGQKSEIELELQPTMTLKPDGTEYEMGEAMPPLYFTRKDGKKRKRSLIQFSFCPFCGEKK